MSDTSWQEEVGRRVVLIQIIVAALLFASIGFLAVAAVLVQLGVVEPDRELAGVMNLVLILFLIGDIIARLVAPSIVVAQQRRMIVAGQWSLPEGTGQGKIAALIERTGDAGRLLGVYRTRTIVASALLEGTAFFAIVVYLLTQSIVGLTVAVVLILGLAWHIPTRCGVVHWIEDQLELVKRERQRREN
jgi:hypothetical protein